MAETNTVNGMVEYINVDNEIHAIASTAYGYCETDATTAIKDVSMPGFKLKTGVTVHIKFANNNSAAKPKLRFNNDDDTTTPIMQYGTTAVGTTATTTGWNDGAVVTLTYDGTNWIRDQGYNTNSTYSYMRPYENTGKGSYNSQGENPAKTGTAGWKFQLTAGKYFMYSQYYDNTAQSALTLNIGNTGAKPIYINDHPSSASNYTLPGGQYLIYYDGTNYYFRTDNKIPGNIAGDAATVNGLTVQTAVPENAVFTDTHKYHKTGSWSGLTYTATAINNAEELQFTIPTGSTSTTVAVGNHNHDIDNLTNASSYLKWQTTAAKSTELYDFGVYVNSNSAAGSSMTNKNYFNILNVPRTKASGNTKADYGWQLGNITENDGRLWYRTAGNNVWGDWQTIAHATQSTSDTGSSSQPVYMTKTGVITPITAVGAAYGGTGQTTLNDSANVLINALTEGTNPATANDYLIAQYAGGGTTTTTYHRRKVSNVVNATVVKAALGTDSSTITQWLNKKGEWSTPTAADVGAITKLSSSTDNAIVRFKGTSGAIQDSKVTINDNGAIALPTEQDINFRMNRKKADSGGWAHGYLNWYDNANNIFAIIGLYGTNDAFDHMYIGANTSYSADTNLQIFSNGTIKGKLFSGSGASLTSLNASNLSSGTVPVARLPLATTSAAGAVTIGSGISVNNGTISVTAGNLGLSSALRYQGTTTTAMSDGLTTAEIKINNTDFTPSAGDVVIYNDAEYLWTGSLWELIGAESSFKKVQTAVNSSSASGNSATTFVSSVTQDTQGVITVKTSTLDTSGTWSGTANKATTTEDTSNTLYVVGVTSGATTTLKRDTSVTIKGGAISATTYNGLTLAAAPTGFTIAGGTTSKTLTVSDTLTLETGNKSYVAYYSENGTISGHNIAHFLDADGKNQLVLGNSTASINDGGASGQIALYSTGKRGTYLNSAANSTSSWYTATLQAKTGIIALTSDIPTAGNGITISDTPTINITGLDTSSGSTTKWLNQKGGWSTPTAAQVGAITKLNSSTDNAIVRFNGAEGAIQDSGIIIDDNDNLILGEDLEFTKKQNYFDTNKDARIIQIVNTDAAANSATVDGGLIIRAVGRNDSTDTVQELLRIRNHEGTTDWASGEFQWKTKDIVVETGDSKHWNIIANKASHATAAHWSAQSRHSTGVLKVKIKEKKAWMLTFTIRVYQGYKYDDYVISGYNYNTRHWTSYNVVLLGSSETDEHFVAFGYDDDANVNDYCTLWVAIPAGDYTGIDIFNVTNGHNQISDFSNLFEIVYEETNIDQLSGVQQTKSCFRPWYRNETVDAANTAKYLQGTIAYSGHTVGEAALTTNPGLGRIQYFYAVNSATTGLFTHSNNANGLLTINTYAQSSGDKYTHQLGFSSDKNLYHRAFGNQDINMDPTSWKQIAYTSSNITGSAASWTDPQTAYVQLSNASTTTEINGGQNTAQVLGVNGILPITNGGTGAETSAAARANLGLGNGKMFYAVCNTAAAAADKVAVCAEFKAADFAAGTIVSVYFQNKNTAAVGDLTLTIAQDDQGTNATTAAPMRHIYNTSGLTNLTGASQLAAGSVIPFIYTGAVWQVIGIDYNNTYTLTEVWSNTGAATAAKVGGNGAYYYIQDPDDATSVNAHYFEMTLRYANTKAEALTLNINSQGAKPIYINGNPSSSTNYTLPRGKYFVYYDGEHYNFRTDGIIPGKVERALADGNGDNIATTYLKSSNFSTTNFNITTTNNTTIIGLKVAAYDTLGVVKPAFSNTSSVTLSASSYTKTGISINSRTSVAGRYYGIEADANGRLYVNIPWEEPQEYDNTISASYSRSDNRLTYSRKMYMIGRLAPVGDTSLLITDTGTGEVSHSFDPYIYATTTTGELSATSHALNVEGVEKAHITYNSTDDSIDFIFN